MKHKDFEKCLICGNGVMHCRSPLFYRIKIDHMMMDLKAVQRAQGLEMMMGGGVEGSVIANAMGPDEDLAFRFSGDTFLICQECSIKDISISRLCEYIEEKKDREGKTNG